MAKLLKYKGNKISEPFLTKKNKNGTNMGYLEFVGICLGVSHVCFVSRCSIFGCNGAFPYDDVHMG